MDNALDNRNLNQGQPVDNVGQDGSVNTQESSGDWENQAKYFQSEKDKLAAENSKLKEYAKVGQFLESRPDIANAVAGMVKGKNSGQPAGPERISLGKDEFDPWEAYNDPQSKSYKFRQQELQDSISGAVNQQMQGLQRNQGVMQLQTELQQRGLNPAEVDSFMKFASANPAEYGVDGAIKMWRSLAESEPSNQVQSPLDDIRQTQENPAVGGVLQGQQPQAPKTDKDSMWDTIVSAGGRTNVLK
jgi:SOS response regulatory protein OraA/RecX